MDRAWWRQYMDEVQASFQGLRITGHQKVSGVKHVKFRKCRHSGEGAIALAAQYGGARRIGLLGYDCQFTGGRAHWHPDHPKRLGNAGTVDKWADHLRTLAAELPGIEILNLTRETALTQWPRFELARFLEGESP